MSTLVLVSHDCGWSGRYSSQAKATYFLSRHSCERAERLRREYERAAVREKAIDRTPQPCLHTRTRHEHGTYVAYTLDRCRCVPCSAATSKYNADTARAKAYGTWDSLVDADTARTHVAALRAAGLGLKTIAELAGVSHGALTKLVYGVHGKPPSRRVSKANHEALLAVPLPSLDAYAGGARLDSTGTRRRLQALIALGWSVLRLTRHSGIDRQVLDATLTGRDVTAAHARAVRDLYNDLWDQTPEAATPGEARGITLAKRRAAQMSWAPPMAWDDDTIDDPNALPAHLDDASAETDDVDVVAVQRAVAGDRGARLTRAERWLALEQLARLGMSDREIAARLGVTDMTILRDRQELGIDSTWKASA